MVSLNLPNISKRRGPLDHVYLAGLNQQRVCLFAETLAQAKQRAVEHFRPKKRDLGLLWVELLEKNDNTPVRIELAS